MLLPMHVIDAVRSVLARMDVTVKRFEFPTDNPIELLPLLVDSLRATRKDFFVLQIGANDGHSDDPIASIVRSRGLRALMVEPLPKMFGLLADFYSDQPNVACENCAIGHEDGSATLFHVRPDPSLPEYVQRVASFSRDVILKQRRAVPNIGSYIETLQVPTLSLATLVAKHHIDRIDLLQVDTEGFDFEILKMLWATPLRPPIINFESAHLSRPDKLACAEMLKRAGYRYLNIGQFDTLAVLQPDA
jgi:FkbM family methyltransferase